jgi:hypothetical protein
MLFQAEALKLEFQNRLLRLLIEFFPALPEIRRYRVSRAGLEGQTGRLLRRQIARQMRQFTEGPTE